MIVLIISLMNLSVSESGITQNASAIGRWAGKDVILVPVSWCVVRGSPVIENPDIPNSNGGRDTTTDQILLKRLERVTDNIYINAGGIGFRSGINNALHSSLHFPNITDPEASGPPGNLTQNNNLREFTPMLHECISAWTNMTINHTGSVDGLFAINVRLFFNNITGLETNTTGFGFCQLNMITTYCGNPYNGHIVVVDNYFMIPGVTSGKFNNDPFDEALGHELGHALSLQHRNSNTSALMNTNQQHYGPGNTVSNIGINGGEVVKLRNSTAPVPGIELDPQKRIVQGETAQSIAVDNIHENSSLKPFEDLSFMKVGYNIKHNLVTFSQNLLGLIPTVAKSKLQYWTLVNLDRNNKTGLTESNLHILGGPATKFSGADLIILSEPTGKNATTGKVWTVKNNVTKPLSGNQFSSEIAITSIHLDTAGTQSHTNPEDIPLYNTINVNLNNAGSFVKLKKAFSLQALVTRNGTVVDKLDDNTNDEGKTLELIQAPFPQCSVTGNATKGQSVYINATGLSPNGDIHAFLGPLLVANSTTDGSGAGTLSFVVPNNTTSGLHLVTVELDKTALTASCVINIKDLSRF
jgi:hypothetical protein